MTDTHFTRSKLSTLLWTSPAPENPGKCFREHQDRGEGWPVPESPKRDLHVPRTSRAPCCLQATGQPRATLPLSPTSPIPALLSLLAPINQNKAFCVPLVRSPIGVWKFSCSFPSIFCHSSELVK